jgi:hypothetical protein
MAHARALGLSKRNPATPGNNPPPALRPEPEEPAPVPDVEELQPAPMHPKKAARTTTDCLGEETGLKTEKLSS